LKSAIAQLKKIIDDWEDHLEQYYNTGTGATSRQKTIEKKLPTFRNALHAYNAALGITHELEKEDNPLTCAHLKSLLYRLLSDHLSDLDGTELEFIRKFEK
jgi:hypothetical protein